MIQTIMNPLTVIQSIYNHSSEVYAGLNAVAQIQEFIIFWMPDQVRHDDSGTFSETINVQNV